MLHRMARAGFLSASFGAQMLLSRPPDAGAPMLLAVSTDHNKNDNNNNNTNLVNIVVARVRILRLLLLCAVIMMLDILLIPKPVLSTQLRAFAHLLSTIACIKKAPSS